jgi:hypothetical protein
LHRCLELLNGDRDIVFRRSEPIAHYFDGQFDGRRHLRYLILRCHGMLLVAGPMTNLSRGPPGVLCWQRLEDRR